MGRGDWFRNTTWDEAIERAFFAKLARSKQKHQYLRIQAYYIQRSHPEAALRLIKHFFDLGDGGIQSAYAYEVQAECWRTLKQFEKAVYSSELALRTEKPNWQTLAYLSLPRLVAEEGLSMHFSRAIELLEANKDRPKLPIERYWWHGTYAVLLYKTGKARDAVQEAERALLATEVLHSGFRNHPNLGLVDDRQDRLRGMLLEICGTRH